MNKRSLSLRLEAAASARITCSQNLKYSLMLLYSCLEAFSVGLSVKHSMGLLEC